ncbi:hypothetical protein CsSME_00010952 [Camellia sinensis var. sinensis]
MENLFSRLGLSISRLQGQGYDGTSNMQSEFNGLKTLILKENPYAYYVHCFAHQLQLALVAVPKNHNQIALLFTLVSNVVNVVGASCKRRDTVREKQATKVAEALNTGNLSSGQGLNQETNLKRAGDTRWGSHYVELMVLNDQLDTYIIDMLSSSEFSMLNGIADLAKKFVETRRDKVYPLVYLLLTLAVILHVATAIVERVFSTMNIVKNRLRNRMGDE